MEWIKILYNTPVHLRNYAIARMIGLCRFQPIPPWLKSPNTQRCPTIDES